jgi:hypothetical protein
MKHLFFLFIELTSVQIPRKLAKGLVIVVRVFNSIVKNRFSL